MIYGKYGNWCENKEKPPLHILSIQQIFEDDDIIFAWQKNQTMNKSASNKRKQSAPHVYMRNTRGTCSMYFTARIQFQSVDIFLHSLSNETWTKGSGCFIFFHRNESLCECVWYLLRFENRDFIENFGKLKDCCALFCHTPFFLPFFNQTKASMQYAMVEISCTESFHLKWLQRICTHLPLCFLSWSRDAFLIYWLKMRRQFLSLSLSAKEDEKKHKNVCVCSAFPFVWQKRVSIWGNRKFLLVTIQSNAANALQGRRCAKLSDLSDFTFSSSQKKKKKNMNCCNLNGIACEDHKVIL